MSRPPAAETPRMSAAPSGLTLGVEDGVNAALETHAELVKSETLAVELVLGPPLSGVAGVPVGEGQQVTLSVTRVGSEKAERVLPR